MTVGKIDRVLVRISRSPSGDMYRDLQGPGTPETEVIQVGPNMTATLSGANFTISPINTADQYVPTQGFTQWAWDVTPTRWGQQVLILTVTVRLLVPGYPAERMDYRVLERAVKVRVNPYFTVFGFIRAHWEWFVGTLIC